MCGGVEWGSERVSGGGEVRLRWSPGGFQVSSRPGRGRFWKSRDRTGPGKSIPGSRDLFPGSGSTGPGSPGGLEGEAGLRYDRIFSHATLFGDEF